MLDDKLLSNDLAVIEYQLGRKPENLAAVVRYCPFKKSAVLLTSPYSEENGVFPTIYWLSCPYLNKEIARLEDDGLVREFGDISKEDKEIRKRLMQAHHRYAQERLDLLSAKDKESIESKSPGILKVLAESGVGGIIDKKGLKCLHTHLAHFLAKKDNPIGEMLWDKVNWPEECDICDIEKK